MANPVTSPQSAVASRRCPACATALDQTRIKARVPPRYAVCGGCSLGHLDPVPTAAEAAARFEDSYFAGDEPGHYPDYGADEPVHRRNADRILDRLEPVRTGPGSGVPPRLLDIGCGYGFLLDQARRRGYDVAGVDVSEHARASARERLGLDIAADLGGVDNEARFDAITGVQVLQHVTDPDALLAEIAARLRPGGMVALETLGRDALVARALGARWQLPAAPWTIWLFDRPSLRQMFDAAGLDVLSVVHARKRISLRHLTGALLARGGADGATESGWRARLAGVAVPYPLGDTILVLGRRR